MSYRYMRGSLDDSWGFLELQDKILEIAVYVDRFCEEHGVDYCLMGGSALGAKRHGGFIPWDDDLDIFMTPDQYEKFRGCFRREGDRDRFYLQEWGAVDGMVTISKVRMNGTTYLEENLKDWDIHQGIYIDIFILHNCPSGRIRQMWQCLWGKYVIMKGLAVRGYDRRGGFLGCALKVMRRMPDRLWVRYGLKQVYRYRNENTPLLCNFLGKAVFSNAIYRREWFEPTERGPFETVQLRRPVNLHEFLTFRFGDYMKPPSPERTRWEQHACLWDCHRDFHEVCPQCTNEYRDETKLI